MCLSFMVACSLLVAATGYAQLNYLSDSRSVSGFARINTAAYSSPPDYVISYSGDYSGSATPSSPFADFSDGPNGVATLVYGMSLPYPPGPNTVTASVGASQNSFLHPQELSYLSHEGGWGTPSQNGTMPSGASSQATSVLQVSFSVSAPVAYSLMCEGTGDPLACSDNWNLNGVNQGVLASGPTPFQVNFEWGVPIYYSGTFIPGDIYTLSLSSAGSLDGGGLRVDLTPVPEPSSTVLLGLGLLLALVWRFRSRVGPRRTPARYRIPCELA